MVRVDLFHYGLASLVVINGIITFMLTPGPGLRITSSGRGFFNPTYWPSLAFRSCICLALAGIYALITASVQKDAALKARIVRWAALWTVPCLAMLPVFGRWYISRIPKDLWANARGAMPTGTMFAGLACMLLGVTLLLALLALAWPRRLHLAFALVVALVAFGAMDSFEFVREAVRKPYVIENYLYANSLYAGPVAGDGGFTVDKVSDAGVLKAARWVNNRELNLGNQVAAGREIFRVECSSCHTPDGYRGIHQLSGSAGVGPGHNQGDDGRLVPDAQRRDAAVCGHRCRAGCAGGLSGNAANCASGRGRRGGWQDGLRA